MRTLKIAICSFVFALCTMHSCQIKNHMTATEIELINNGTENDAFYVLKTTEELDSLFLRMASKDFEPKIIAKDKDIQLLLKRMQTTLLEEQGVGLAGSQIGISRNVFLFMRIDKPEENSPIQIAINPKIVNHPSEMVCFEGDGCLSIPNVSGNTSRYPWIDVEYYDEKGVLHQERLSGHSRDTDFTGVIFQHEYDHLEGILFIDKLCEE